MISVAQYTAPAADNRRDGVTFAHVNNNKIFEHCDANYHNLRIDWHDFGQLIVDLDYAAYKLRNIEVVFSNVGPYAHLYFFLREKLNLNFKIVRDVRTAFWAGYLFQEFLIEGMERDGDILMVSSNYSAAVQKRLFPNIRSKLFKCYPLRFSFPNIIQSSGLCGSDTHKVLYLGRISAGKGFTEAKKAVELINGKRAIGRAVELIAAGQIYDHGYQNILTSSSAKSNNSSVKYLGILNHEDIWRQIEGSTCTIFPSTSSFETFGRVIAESQHCGRQVITARHAAAEELSNDRGMADVSYTEDFTFSANNDTPIGKVDVTSLADAIDKTLSHPLPPQKNSEDEEAFIKSIISGFSDIVHPGAPTPAQKQIVERIQLVKTYSECTRQRMRKETWEIMQFILLRNKMHLNTESLIIRKFLKAYVKRTTSKFDLSNLGDVDLAVCEAVGFSPMFHCSGR